MYLLTQRYRNTSVVNVLHTAYRRKWLKFATISSNFKRLWSISRLTAPILGLFVLIWMHFSRWIRTWQWQFEISKISEKSWKIFGLSSALDMCVERINMKWDKKTEFEHAPFLFFYHFQVFSFSNWCTAMDLCNGLLLRKLHRGIYLPHHFALIHGRSRPSTM